MRVTKTHFTSILARMPVATAAAVLSELARAEKASQDGEHPGMVRVCCRRAAGEAITALWKYSSEPASAMARLDALAAHADTPAEVSAAARRLRGAGTSSESRAFSEDPFGDLLLILTYLQQGTDMEPTLHSRSEQQ